MTDVLKYHIQVEAVAHQKTLLANSMMNYHHHGGGTGGMKSVTDKASESASIRSMHSCLSSQTTATTKLVQRERIYSTD